METLYTGVVENRHDPLKLGRCQVRVMGLHTYDKSLLPTKDLPWAYPMQPAISAAMSGIGYAPVGPVEGTVVVVMFRDFPENQHPVIIGSIGGIPQEPGAIDQEDNGPIIKKDGYTVDPNEASPPVTTEDGSVVDQNTARPEDTGLAPVSSYHISAEGLALIKQYEGVKLTAYQDSVGVWTIGYGTTRIGGNPVQPGQTITQQQADELLMQHIAKEVEPAVQGKVKAPITQSMFDALCSFTYNLGGGTLGRSSLCSELNSTKYEECANLFPDYNKAGGKVLAGLTKRRMAEQQLFLKDGIPSVTGELIPSESPVPPVGSQQTVTTPSGTTTTVTSTGRVNPTGNIGFKDPDGKYPLYTNEPDTNKLARHEDIKKTVVFKKEQTRDMGVATAQGKIWNQSPIPYNANYPFNHVFMSESGHIMEFDDTEHRERIHLYHRKGTFFEIDANGTRVTRIVGDDYEILERNGYVHVKGTMNVTIDGDSNVRVNNALNVDVYGKTTINVFNDVDMNVSGTMDLSVKEDLNIRAQNINMEANSTINVRSTTLNESAANINLNASSVYRETVNQSHYRWNGDRYTYVGADTYSRHNSGTDFGCPDPTRGGSTACPKVATATRAAKSGLATPQPRQSPELPEFSALQVITRVIEAAAVYETPEEGDPTNYINKRLDEGTLSPAEKDSGTIQDTKTTPENKLIGLNPVCEALNGAEITADLQLSKSFTLGQLCQNGTRMPVDQLGLTAAEITCNLKCLAESVLDTIKARYPGMMITSAFRRPGDAAGSSPKSQHYTGEAADIVIQGFDRQKHYEAILEIQKVVPYDQLLLEYSGANTVWIHVSYSSKGNRKQNFTMRDHKRVSEFGAYTLIT